MIRIHTGEHWKINPDYVRSLQGFRPRRGKSFTAAGVLDVLGIEIDGASFGGHLGEEAIFRLVPDLVDAVSQLCRGQASSRQVSLTEAGLELVIARRGASHVSMCLLSFRRPARIVVPDLEVELSGLADAVRDCAARLISDLAGINPALRQTPFVKALARGLKRLEVTGRVPAPALPGNAKGPGAEGVAARPKAADLAIGFELLDDEGRIESATGKAPDLHSLLVSGRVFLHDEQGAELASSSGPVFLLFTELVRVAADLIRVAESGETPFQFCLAADARPMPLDLRTKVLLVDGRAVRCGPLALARTVLEAVVDFTGAIRERNPRQTSNGYLSDLAERAHAELRMLSDLERGDLVSGSTSLPRPVRSAAEPPLGDGKLRKLSYRVAWRATVRGPVWGLKLCGPVLWVGSGQASLALDAAHGRELWHPKKDSISALLDDKRVLVLNPGQHVAMCELATGAAQWFRSRPSFSVIGQRILWIGAGPKPSGICAVVDGRRVWAADAFTGRTLWEFSPPLAAHVWLAGGGPAILVSADSGFAYALDPSTGTPLWRTRTGKSLDGEPVLGGKLAVLPASTGHEAWLIGLDGSTGRPAFARALELEEGIAIVPGPRRLIAIGTESREPFAVGLSRTGALLWRTSLPIGRGTPAAVRASGALFVAGRDGSVCRLEDSGKVSWFRAPGGEELGHAVVPLHRRGVLAAAGTRVELLDPGTGKVLDQLDPVPGLAAMENDRALGVFAADEEGSVVAYRLATHLSVVG